MDSELIVKKLERGSFYDLLNIDEALINDSIIDTISYLEQKIPTLPKGTIKNNILLFHLISLINNKIPFSVKGGFIVQYYLNNNLRPTYDLDFLTYLDSDSFYKLLKEELDNYRGEVSFVIKEYHNVDATTNYFYNTIHIIIDVMYNGNFYQELTMDGTSSNLFKDIDTCYYMGPKVLGGFKFSGVKAEFVLAEKIDALTNELSRSYKHLIDVYSLIKKDIDLDLLKKYLSIIQDINNLVRDKYDLDKSKNQYLIKDNKKFNGNYILPCLQAGYNLCFEVIKEEVNEWLKNNL